MKTSIEGALELVNQAKHALLICVAAETWQKLQSSENYGEDNAWGWAMGLGLPTKVVQAVMTMEGVRGHSVQSLFDSSLRFLDEGTYPFLLSDVLGVTADEVRQCLSANDAHDLKEHLKAALVTEHHKKLKAL
jgi:hypothetical protein